MADDDDAAVRGRTCDAEHVGCGGLCKEKGDSYGKHAGQHACNKCNSAFGGY